MCAVGVLVCLSGLRLPLHISNHKRVGLEYSSVIVLVASLNGDCQSVRFEVGFDVVRQLGQSCPPSEAR